MSERIISYYTEKTIATKEENWASIFSILRFDGPISIFNKKIKKTWLKLPIIGKDKKNQISSPPQR